MTRKGPNLYALWYWNKDRANVFDVGRGQGRCHFLVPLSDQTLDLKVYLSAILGSQDLGEALGRQKYLSALHLGKWSQSHQRVIKHEVHLGKQAIDLAT